MSIERQTGFETKRVARPQTDRNGAARRKLVPDRERILPFDEELEANGLPRVSRPGHLDPGAADGDGAEGISHRLGQVIRTNHPGENFLGARTLKTQHGDLESMILHLGLGEMFTLRLQVLPVFFSIGRIDDEDVLVFDETIQISVVESTTALVGNHGVLAEPHVQAGRIVRQHVLKERQGLLSSNLESSHVRHIKKPGVLPGRQMLLDDSRGELDRHIPPAELGDFGPEVYVAFVEYRSKCLLHRLIPRSSGFSFLVETH